MREQIKDRGRLLHIQNAIDTILEHTEDVTFEAFLNDKILYAAMVYYTMIIGEASYKLSKEFVAEYNETNWRAIADMRHHLVHGYYQVNPRDIWDVICNDLRPLRMQVERYLKDIDWEKWESDKY